MKTRETTPGKTYSVHTSSGCTVSDKNGWQKTIDAPDGYFTAHAGEVTIDGDDAADIRELFKLAPQQKLALLGVLGGGDPAWFKALREELTAMLDGSAFELAWLAGKKQLVVHTDRVSDDMLAAVKATAEAAAPAGAEVVQYNHNVEVSWRDINKYAECSSREDMLAVNPDYKNDFTRDGEWIYPLTKMEVCSNRYGTPPWYLFEGVNQRRFSTEMPAATNVYRMFYGASFDEVRVTLPNFTDQSQGVIFGNANIKKAVLVAPKWQDMGWLCNGACIETLEIDAPVTKLDIMAPNKGKYVLKNVRLTTTQLSTADGAFQKAQLTRESALHILGILPTYTSGSHPLTIGIHVDYQNDDEVLAAIANAEANGWTMTVQWNGTPTAQASVTYGLRKPPIYAKVAELERPGGTTERVLDWGHYVTDPTGYEEFRSVEAAREYFGLPDETLTKTE